jgi:hypothetical protein
MWADKARGSESEAETIRRSIHAYSQIVAESAA